MGWKVGPCRTGPLSQALDDLQAVVRYISKEDPDAARRVGVELDTPIIPRAVALK
jgi:hypothetical protein